VRKNFIVAAGSLLVHIFVVCPTFGNAPHPVPEGETDDGGNTRLVPAGTSMVTAWDFPMNPLTDSTLGHSARAEEIRRGFRIFMQTPREAPRFAANKLSCGSCHLNGGQRERALPLVGVAGVFPEFNKRAGRPFMLEDRIVECLLRSENGTGASRPAGGVRSRQQENQAYPDTGSAEVAALAAYIVWLSDGLPSGSPLPWRGKNVIVRDSSLSVENFDPVRGKSLYMTNCSSCHGKDGQAVRIGDKKAGPLWGPYSWNDGAGMARIYTLAGFIRYAMPYLNPGGLNSEEAQQIAAFINSLPRPVYPHKERDYLGTNIPPDAVYYRQRHQASGR
jgi:thiosulfate dehydrogenase